MCVPPVQRSKSAETTSPSTTSAAAPLGFAFFCFVAIGGGAAAAVQASVNARLGQIAVYATLSTVISFCSGLAILTLLVGFELLIARSRGTPKACFVWSERPHISLLLPGTLGVIFVSSTIFLTRFTGYSLFWVSVVTGQLSAAVVADARGWGVAVPLSFTRIRFVALALCATGVALTISEEVATPAATVGAVIGSCIAGICVGTVTIVQSVLNRFASALLPSKLQATWMSFFFGLPSALLVFALQVAAMPSFIPDVSPRLNAGRPFIWLGGALGVLYVFASIYVPSYIGTQAFAVSQILGQLVGAAVIDSMGLFETPVREITAVRVVGLLLIIIAAAALKFG